MSPFNVGVYQGWNAEALHQLARLLNMAKNEVPCYMPQAEVAESRETGITATGQAANEVPAHSRNRK